MSGRYFQVVRTYWQRWLFWVLLAPTLAIVLPLVIWRPEERAFSLSLIVPISAAGAWWAASIVAHLKEQLADVRSVLLPHFRAPHVLVAVVGIALMILFVPAALGGWLKLSPLGFAAVVMLIAALTAWLAYLQSVPATGIWIAMGLLTLSKTVRLELIDALDGTSHTAALVLLATGAALLFALIVRMIRLNEDMPEYGRQPITMWSLRPAMTGDRTLRLAAAETHWLNAALAHRAYKIKRLSNIYEAGFWRRVARWRIVTGPGWAPWIVGFALAIWATVMPWWEAARNRSPVPEGVATLLPFLALPFVAFGWLRRWHSLGYELTRPGTRRGMFLEMGAAMVIDLLEAWIALVVASWIPLLIWQPGLILQMLLSPFYPVIAVSTLLMAGLIIRVLRFRIGWFAAIAILLGTFGTMLLTGLFFLILEFASGPFNATQNPLIAYAAIPIWLLLALLILAGLLLAHGYASWCETDLD